MPPNRKQSARKSTKPRKQEAEEVPDHEVMESVKKALKGKPLKGQQTLGLLREAQLLKRLEKRAQKQNNDHTIVTFTKDGKMNVTQK